MVKENTLYEPYHSSEVNEKLQAAIKREIRLYEVTFSRKSLQNGGAVWGGGLSVFMNESGEIIVVEKGA